MRQSVLRGALTGVFLAAGLAGLTGRSSAQEITYSASEIRACLCAQQAVTSLSSQVKAEHRAYQAKRDEVDLLNKEAEEARGRVNVNNQDDVEAFRQLLDKRDTAALELSNRLQPRYAAIVARYNEAVAENNSYCTGKLFDREQIASVRSTLSCPQE